MCEITFLVLFSYENPKIKFSLRHFQLRVIYSLHRNLFMDFHFYWLTNYSTWPIFHNSRKIFNSGIADNFIPYQAYYVVAGIISNVIFWVILVWSTECCFYLGILIGYSALKIDFHWEFEGAEGIRIILYVI